MATTLFLVRHAKAADRAGWSGADRDRPLTGRGRAQAERLALALAPERPVLVAASAAMHPGRAAVAVGHGDLIPMYLLRAGVLDGLPDFRTGSLFRVRVEDGRPVEAVYVDRRDLHGRGAVPERP